MSRKRPSASSAESSKRQRYEETDLLGLKVSHSESLFKEGQDVILTLKDANVLDDGEDVLENVNLTDLEKANRNVDNKLNKTNYNPFDEPEYDSFGRFKKKGLLSKYDEEIEGLKKEAFRIGLDEKRRLEQLDEIKKSDRGEISLALPKYKIASEYFTEEEIVSFKKPKKSKKSSKKSTRSVEEDHGSRNQVKKSKKIKTENDQPVEIKKERIVIDEEMNRNESDSEDDFEIPDDEIYGKAIEEDDLQRDLMKSLEQARKLKQKQNIKTEANLEKLSETIIAMNEEEMNNDQLNGQINQDQNEIVINSTAEFCRNLGDLSTLKYSKEHDELLDFEKDLLEEKEEQDKMDIDEDDEEKYSARNKWNEVEFKSEQPKLELKDAKAVILEEEPDVSRGLAGALKLSMKKGYLDKEIKKSNISVRASSLQAKNYTIEEKFYEDDKFSRRERYNGSLCEFKDKAHYKPNVKLEYNDDSGRVLNEKEAFRVLSHKFHGKAPGKNKIDKRMKKLQQEIKLKSMTSIDTPLGTTRLLQEKQKELHTPYVILSANQNALSKKS